MSLLQIIIYIAKSILQYIFPNMPIGKVILYLIGVAVATIAYTIGWFVLARHMIRHHGWEDVWHIDD